MLALISGGGSALCAAPAPGLTLADKQAINRALLASGANISEMNCVRKHLSAIKGGRLAAAAAPARVVTLAISDVPGDDPAVIASGPTVPDPTTFADARAIIARYGITPSPAVAARLATATDETPKPGELPHSEFRLIATPMMALHRVAETARSLELTPLILGDALEGEAARDGHVLFAGIAHCVAHARPAAAPPAVLLSGGETTVTIGRGAGRARRAQHRIPAVARGRPGGTPRASGRSPATPTASTARTTPPAPSSRPTRWPAPAPPGLDPRAVLAGHDSYTLFDAIGDLISTGPTLTNVNDIRAI